MVTMARRAYVITQLGVMLLLLSCWVDGREVLKNVGNRKDTDGECSTSPQLKPLPLESGVPIFHLIWMYHAGEEVYLMK